MRTEEPDHAVPIDMGDGKLSRAPLVQRRDDERWHMVRTSLRKPRLPASLIVPMPLHLAVEGAF
jgi:hypothetical protein